MYSALTAQCPEYIKDVVTSDVKFHEIFWREIFHEIFPDISEIFQKLFAMFSSGNTD